MSEPMVLAVDRLRCGYGQATVVRDLSLSIARGEGLALLGKNGMGKTTLLKGIMGFLPRQGGHGAVSTAGRSPPASRTCWRRRASPMRCRRRRCSRISASRTTCAWRSPTGGASATGWSASAATSRSSRKRLRQKAGTLSGGEQKMLILGRGLMARPRLMLIDEITEGLQPSVIERISGVLQAERKASSIAMLIVEQNVDFALKTADRYAVLERGELGEQGRTGDADAHTRIFRKLGL